jgi:ribosomal protein L37AE/L43A
MGHPQDFPFDIMDVAELLHLRIRRRQANSVYVDCPFCGDKRGKMNINFALNVWRCNYCDEHGGMLALYAKVYGISNSDAYREICEALQTGLPAPEYTVGDFQHKEKQEVPQAELASIQEIHQTLSVLMGMLTLSKKHREHLQTKRGLTDDQIDRLGYKSTPPFYLCRALTEKLLNQHCTVQGVPGFYVNDDGKWTVNFNSVTAGIIIPARGIDGMLRGAQIRLDVPIKNKDDPPEKDGAKYIWLASTSKKMGVTSGSPIHFVGDPFARAIYVTEGYES